MQFLVRYGCRRAAAAWWRTFVDGCCSRFRSGSRDASSRLSGPGDVDVTCTPSSKQVKHTDVDNMSRIPIGQDLGGGDELS